MRQTGDVLRVAAAKAGPRWVTPEPLNVGADIVGLPLATPMRRAAAMAVDLLVIALLTGVSGLWLLAGLALVVLQLRQRQRIVVSGRRAAVGWIGAALVSLLALQEATSQWEAWRHPGAAAEGAAERAAERALDSEPEASTPAEPPTATVAAAATASSPLGDATGASAAAGASAASGASVVSGAASASDAAASNARRIAQLEAELAAARKPRLQGWRDRVTGFLDEIGAGLGWGIVYFSLLPAWWGGQTVGKKLFGLRVVELTGRPMTVMRSLKRYGGYAAGMATGGLGFAQLLWDPNRQGLHDKAAHTAVVDLRAPRLQAAVAGEPHAKADAASQPLLKADAAGELPLKADAAATPQPEDPAASGLPRQNA
jgi:hypothetical protein